MTEKRKPVVVHDGVSPQRRMRELRAKLEESTQAIKEIDPDVWASIFSDWLSDWRADRAQAPWTFGFETTNGFNPDSKVKINLVPCDATRSSDEVDSILLVHEKVSSFIDSRLNYILDTTAELCELRNFPSCKEHAMAFILQKLIILIDYFSYIKGEMGIFCDDAYSALLLFNRMASGLMPFQPEAKVFVEQDNYPLFSLETIVALWEQFCETQRPECPIDGNPGNYWYMTIPPGWVTYEQLAKSAAKKNVDLLKPKFSVQIDLALFSAFRTIMSTARDVQVPPVAERPSETGPLVGNLQIPIPPPYSFRDLGLAAPTDDYDTLLVTLPWLQKPKLISFHEIGAVNRNTKKANTAWNDLYRCVSNNGILKYRTLGYERKNHNLVKQRTSRVRKLLRHLFALDANFDPFRFIRGDGHWVIKADCCEHLRRE